jgi:uncharacterized membrane protein
MRRFALQTKVIRVYNNLDMFRIDKSTFEYMKDLSDPDVRSSTDLESLELKRQIIRTNLLTLVIGTFVIGMIIILFIFYLPGLFTVFQQILLYYFASIFSYWPFLLGVFFVFMVIFYFSSKHS